MLLTKETIEKRIATLRKNLEQVTAQGNGIVGAIQDCEHWLAILDQPEPAKQPEKKE